VAHYKCFILLASLIVSPYVALWSQVNTATVYGTVTDPGGRVIAKAAAQARNILTNIVTNATTDERGDFAFNFLPAGEYAFSVQAPGFEGQIRQSVSLSAGQTQHVDFRLNVSATKETITVSGSASQLAVDSSEQYSVFQDQDVHELPLSKLDWTSLLNLENGMQSSGGQGGVSINGMAPSGMNLTVDGTNASSNTESTSLSFSGGFNTINTINSEAIAEVTTTKGIAPASVAGSMSGNVNVITKSGTNKYHGSLFALNSLSAYNARNQFLSSKPRSTFNEWGGSLGGRFIRDKLFFFGAYAAVRNSSFSALSGTVPTPEFAASTLAVQPIYASVFAAFPKPTAAYSSTAQTASFNGTGALSQEDSNGVGRLDYYFSAKDFLSFRATRARPSQTQPKLIPSDPRITSGHNEAYTTQFTHSEAAWTFVTRFGYNQVYVDRLDAGYNLGLQQVQFSGFNSLGAENLIFSGKTLTWEETVAKTIGRHSLEFGGIIQRWNTGRNDDTTNSFSYSSTSDFLANIPSQVSLNFPLLPFQMHMYEFGGFVQDTFRVRSDLTLNLGIRYNLYTVPQEPHNRIFNRNASSLGPGFGDFRPPTEMYNLDTTDFAPRAGFAWSLGRQRNTVIRAGAGIFFSPHTIRGGPIEEVLTAANIPFRLTLSRAQLLAQGLKFGLDRAAVQAQIAATGQPIANTTISPNFPNPSSYQWTFGLQRQLPFGLTLETAYIGNRSLFLNETRTLNLPDRLTGISPSSVFGQFRWYDGSDASFYDAWQSSLRKRFSHGLTLTANYTWASNTSYGQGDLQLQDAPQDNNNLRAERGPTPYSIRNTLKAYFVYEIPFARWMGVRNPVVSRIVGGWQLSGVLVARTGTPVNITDSKSSYPSSRPDAVFGVDPVFDDFQSTLRYLNPKAFAQVPIATASGASIRPGNVGRNAIYGPGSWTVDSALAKNIAIRERIRGQLRADLFNALNHTNLGGLSTNVNSSNFGRLTSATARSMQVGVKIQF
jgi:hypothetical protein